ncbi:hypothetical protein SVIO_024090 [Streptomyces violaceusniger]|uniref:Uncharacterized protein n=1 Tax=Streptomyces violaceusniger TaxID=68280 RepID=A0A4D4KY64_STRVO|nr:hypothetical protein SVIO_024090 [Streptomyces violaceusniger]
MPDATFARPDLAKFRRLDELGLTVTGQRLEPDRAVLACRVHQDTVPSCRSRALAVATRAVRAQAQQGHPAPEEVAQFRDVLAHSLPYRAALCPVRGEQRVKDGGTARVVQVHEVRGGVVDPGVDPVEQAREPDPTARPAGDQCVAGVHVAVDGHRHGRPAVVVLQPAQPVGSAPTGQPEPGVGLVELAGDPRAGPVRSRVRQAGRRGRQGVQRDQHTGHWAFDLADPAVADPAEAYATGDHLLLLVPRRKGQIPDTFQGQELRPMRDRITRTLPEAAHTPCPA